MTVTRHQTLLVTGASGHLGRRVIELLLEANAGHVIATTRSPDKLADLAARGVEVRHADFDDPSSLAAAFAGADRLLPIYIQEAPDPAWTRAPIHSQPELDLSEGPHMGYALQWFAFAVILRAGYLRYLAGEIRSPANRTSVPAFDDGR